MQNNNTIAEIFIGIGASLLILGSILLLYVGKIDGTFATLMFGAAAALFGGNLALKAPSPSQQAQIGAQQQQIGAIAQNQQQLTSQVLSVLPTVVSAATQQQPPQQTAAPPSQVQPPPVQAPQQAPAPMVSNPWAANTTNTFPLPTVPRQ